jgi:dephospho-CoA kinase
MKDYELWTLEHKDKPYSLKEAALLFESESYKSLHKVIVVTSPIETRIGRIMKRDHVKREDILKRIQNQRTDRERMSMADWVIYNDGIHSLIEQTMEVHHTILQIIKNGVVPFKS